MENLLTNGFNIWILVKALALVILGMYLIFAFVITRQVKLMTSTLHLGFDAPAIGDNHPLGAVHAEFRGCAHRHNRCALHNVPPRAAVVGGCAALSCKRHGLGQHN